MPGSLVSGAKRVTQERSPIRGGSHLNALSGIVVPGP